MSELKKRIHDDKNDLDYVLVGDYYIPDLRLPEQDGRPIGRWGRMHREYLKQERPILYNELILSGQLHSYLADLNEQAAERKSRMMVQFMEAEGVNEELKRSDWLEWLRRVNNIQNRVDEIICAELVLC